MHGNTRCDLLNIAFVSNMQSVTDSWHFNVRWFHILVRLAQFQMILKLNLNFSIWKM